MREFKIFLVVACFTALVYWGVEPYAHSVMKPHVAPANFDFKIEDTAYAQSVLKAAQNELEAAKADLAKAEEKSVEEEVSSAKAKVEAANKKLESAQASLDKINALYAQVDKIDFAKGDGARGKAFFEGNCYACHGAKIDDLPANITDSSMGVVPPDLSSAANLYGDKFLAALVLQPAIALKVDHKFGDAFIMSAYNSDTTGESEEVVNANIADLIAYLNEIGAKYKANFESSLSANLDEKYAKLTLDSETHKTLWQKDFAFEVDKNNFIEACARCHSMRYDALNALSAKADLMNYLGSNPPDLSMMIRSRGDEYLNNFINNTQKLLPGTAMPRVGLNEEAQKSIVAYIEKVGDNKKEERESLGLYIMGFFVILSIFAILWKRKIWANLH